MNFETMAWEEVLQLRAAVNEYVKAERPARRARAHELREELRGLRTKVGGKRRAQTQETVAEQPKKKKKKK